MQKSNKKLAGKIAALVLMLTVISCCFVGSTFAKYTSSKTGTATVSAAKWEVTGVSENSTSQEFAMTAKLSPALEAATTADGDEESGSTLKNTVSATYTITNKSDVDATIAWSLGDYTINAVTGATYNGENVSYTKGTGFTYGTTPTTFLTDQNVKDTINVTLSAKKGDAEFTSGSTLSAKNGETTESVTITVTATWTTATSDGDKIDTLIGMYVDSITQKLTVTATQASTVQTQSTPAA